MIQKCDLYHLQYDFLDYVFNSILVLHRDYELAQSSLETRQIVKSDIVLERKHMESWIDSLREKLINFDWKCDDEVFTAKKNSRFDKYFYEKSLYNHAKVLFGIGLIANVVPVQHKERWAVEANLNVRTEIQNLEMRHHEKKVGDDLYLAIIMANVDFNDLDYQN